MSRSSIIESVMGVLKNTGGYFVLRSEGQEYVVISKKEFEELEVASREVQLELPTDARAGLGDGEIEKANRDIAVVQIEQQDEVEELVRDLGKPIGPRRTVRFEPLRGDLPPELQE